MHDVSMRTTLTLDPDVAERIRQELASGKRTLKDVVNERLRAGFGWTVAEAAAPYRVEPHRSAYRSGIDRGRLNALADELDADAFVEKGRPG
jgi:hypothetical protein